MKLLTSDASRRDANRGAPPVPRSLCGGTWVYKGPRATKPAANRAGQLPADHWSKVKRPLI